MVCALESKELRNQVQRAREFSQPESTDNECHVGSGVTSRMAVSKVSKYNAHIYCCQKIASRSNGGTTHMYSAFPNLLQKENRQRRLICINQAVLRCAELRSLTQRVHRTWNAQHTGCEYY